MQDLAIPSTAAPKRAHGRSLSDFRIDGATTPHGLLPAEEKLLGHVERGVACPVSTLDWKKPEDLERLKGDKQHRIRAEFLRFLALGGDDAVPVHENGVELVGAYIEGDLDLRGGASVAFLNVADSYFNKSLTLDDAHMRGLELPGCRVGGLSGDRARIDGPLFLRNGFLAEGEVTLSGATIGGFLDCGRGSFKNAGGTALHCDRIKVKDGVHLREGFAAEGAVRFLGAEIGGDLDCTQGSFRNAGRLALSCSGAKITRYAFLRGGFTAEGEVRLLGTEIGGDLDCTQGSFMNAGGDALDCSSATIARCIHLRDGFRAEGVLRFSGAQAQHLIDDDAACDKATSCELVLDGFTYERISGDAPTQANKRIAWLGRQVPAHLSATKFRPQPFEQLAKVLSAMGHDEDARKVAIEKQKLMVPVRVQQAAGMAKPLVWLLWRLHWLTSGFGYRPGRLILILLALWIVGGLFYAKAADFGVFVPADRHVRTDETLKMCRLNWTQCDAANIVAFRPFAYSADNLLPAIDLGQRKAWVVSGWVGALVAIQSLLGVVGTLLFGAIVTGLIKKG